MVKPQDMHDESLATSATPQPRHCRVNVDYDALSTSAIAPQAFFDCQHQEGRLD